MPKNAILTTSAVYVGCPHCFGGVPSPTGSYAWTVGELQNAAGTSVACDDCGTGVKIPSAKRVSLE